MGPARKPLLEGAEHIFNHVKHREARSAYLTNVSSAGFRSGQNGKVICDACSNASPSGQLSINSNGIGRHIGTQGHKNAIAREQRRQEKHCDLEVLEARDRTAALLTTGSALDKPSVVAPDIPSNTMDPFASTSFSDGNLYDDCGDKFTFSAGEQSSTSERTRLLRELENIGLYSPASGDDGIPIYFRGLNLFDGYEDATLTNAAAEFDALNMDSESDTSDCEEDREKMISPDHPWYPHGSKVMFLLDMLDNMPRLRLSTDHIKFILWILKDLGIPGVPSFVALHCMQDRLNKMTNICTSMKRSPCGNIFYQNRMADLIALDWANPQVRPYIEEYPIRSCKISESCHTEKWHRDVNPEHHAPMWANGSQHFFLGEISRLQSGQLVVPTQWYCYKSQGEVYAEGHEVVFDATINIFRICENSKIEFRTSELVHNYYNLADKGIVPKYSHPVPDGIYEGSNPLREIAQGRRMYISYVKPWGDDVSGNRSKQYNEHTNIYFAHANLPHDKLSQEYFVQFCSTSPHASLGEQFDAMMSDILLSALFNFCHVKLTDSISGTNTWNSAYD